MANSSSVNLTRMDLVLFIFLFLVIKKKLSYRRPQGWELNAVRLAMWNIFIKCPTLRLSRKYLTYAFEYIIIVIKNWSYN